MMDDGTESKCLQDEARVRHRDGSPESGTTHPRTVRVDKQPRNIPQKTYHISLLSFPNELLIQVAKYLDLKSLYALLRANHHLAILLPQTLLSYALNEERHCVTALYFAAANGDADRLRTLLEKGPSISVEHIRDGVLTWVIKGDLIDGKPNVDHVLRLLLEKGRDSIIHNSCNGATALHYAAWCGDEIMTKRLLEKGIIDVGDDNERRALHWAAERGRGKRIECTCAGAKSNEEDELLATKGNHQGVITLLLDHGVNIDACDFEDKTALYGAVVEGNRTMDELAIDFEHDTGGPNETQTHQAISDNTAIVKLLCEKGAATRELLYRVASRGEVEAVKLLLDHGACGDTALYYAANRLNAQVTNLFLSLGANANYLHSRYGLHWAVQYGGSMAVAKALRSTGVDVNLLDRYGDTALHLAVNYSVAKATLIIQAGANINARDNAGNTPLHRAVRRNMKDVVVMLVAMGADTTIRNYTSLLPIDLADEGQDIAHILEPPRA